MQAFDVEDACQVLPLRDKLDSLVENLHQSLMHEVLEKRMMPHLQFMETFFKFFRLRTRERLEKSLRAQFARNLDSISTLQGGLTRSRRRWQSAGRPGRR